jgi:hypothetical protein
MLCALYLPESLLAGETDQFLAGDIEIKDSYLVYNNYYQKIMDDAEYSGQNLNCTQFTEKLLGKILKNLNHISTKSNEVERFPDDNLSAKEYLDLSIYKNAGSGFHLLNHLRRTINIGGVYIGTDKFGHFGLIGKNYYRHYQGHLNKGFTPDEALKKTISKGIIQELNILGYHFNGVLSFADLEANYQGLLFAKSICNGENPYFSLRDGQWVRNYEKNFDIRKYINPKMDESYNPSFRRPALWKKVKNNIQKKYCYLINNAVFLERRNIYNKRIEETLNDFYIKEYFRSRPKFDRTLESMDDLCR